jgi:diamine N-acetyltransferase
MPGAKPRVSLSPVNRDNFRECVGMKVAEGQENFVAPNVYSIAQSKVEPGCVPLVVYADENMVGFAMYTLDPDDGKYWVHRLMVSAESQGKGYGRAAMEALIEILEEKPDCDEILISWVPENTAAEKLYENLGFVKTGEIEDGEIVARFTFG